MDGFGISAEYTGRKPDLRPAARAVLQAIKKEIGEDGTFIDPEMEREYREWKKKRAAGAATPHGNQRKVVRLYEV